MDFLEEEFKLKLAEYSFVQKNLEIKNRMFITVASKFEKSFLDFIDELPPEEKDILNRALRWTPDRDKDIQKQHSKTADNAKQKHTEQKKKKKENAEDINKEKKEIETARKSKRLPPDIKKIYHKVASKIHPDKARNDEEREKNTILFTKLQQAISNFDIMSILVLADQYGVDISKNMDLDPELVQVQIDKTRQMIKNVKETVAWQWHKSESEEGRKHIFKSYASYLLDELEKDN